MKLIKRYVIEYANDCLKLLENTNKFETMRKIDRIVHSCNYGYISNMEAIKAITDLMNE